MEKDVTVMDKRMEVFIGVNDAVRQQVIQRDCDGKLVCQENDKIICSLGMI